MVTTNYYQSVVGITEGLLGPAAKRFIDRQIVFHLNKQPENLNREDVIKLRETFRIALGLLVDDRKIVDDTIKKLDVIIDS